MAGLSGSGKSTTAQRLAQQSYAIRLRSDAVRKHLAGIDLHEKGGDEIYTPAMTDKTYTRLIELGVSLATRGDRIILDAKFDRQAKRQEALIAANQQTLPITFVHCTAPPEVLRSRVKQRSGDIADATTEILAQQTMEPFTNSDPVITIDTTQSVEDLKPLLSQVF
ncbi:MAG: AAA family ATPase [Cyanobacteria bacterium P01_C01_bin.69]